MPIQRLQTYSDFEARQQAILEQMRKRDMECVSCPSCECQFFEQLEICKYKADHALVLGQEVPPKPGSQPYRILKCVRCGDLLEPGIIENSRDTLSGDYSELIGILEAEQKKKEAEKKTEEELEKGNAIPSQEL